MKFVLIGNACTGKSSLAWRYKFDEFRDYLVSTIGVDVQTKKYQLFNDTVNVLLWDTAGQEKFKSLCPAFYRDSVGIFLCFDFTDRQSYEDISKWMELMLPYLPKYVNINLIGLKSELKEQYEVSELEAIAFARKHCMDFYPVSAKTGENVEKIFLNNVEKIFADYKGKKFIPEERLGGFRIQKESKNDRYKYNCFWNW